MRSRYTNKSTVRHTPRKPKPKLIKVRAEFHREMKELAMREGRDIGEAIEWLCRDGLLYREEHKDNYIP